MVFKSLKHKLAYQLNGYFVIEGFLDKNQLEQLQLFYERLNLFAHTRVSSYGVYTNNKEDLTAAQNKEIDAYITSVCMPSVQRYFKDYKVGGSIFLLKGKGDESVPMHQDWNMVDEKENISFAIWSPLVDVDEGNGCLHVIPGSHRWFKNLRSSTIQSVFLPLHSLSTSLKSIPIKKGDAVIYAHSLFHGSLPNKSAITRPTVCLSVLPINAQQINYVNDGVEVKLMDANTDYYIESNNTIKEARTLKTIPFKDDYKLSDERFWKKHNQLGIRKLIARWMHILSK